MQLRKGERGLPARSSRHPAGEGRTDFLSPNGELPRGSGLVGKMPTSTGKDARAPLFFLH
jgi:hypothetical protein